MTTEPDVSVRATKQYIASGADVNLWYNHKGKGHTPLTHAATDGRALSLKLLLDAGAKVQARNCRHELALTCAALRHHANCVHMLATRSSHGDVAEAMVHACHCRDTEALTLLVNASRDAINTRAPCGDTPLTKACAAEASAHCVQVLLERGADVNATNERGWSPLAVAAMQGCRNVSQALLAHPCIDVNRVVDLRDDRDVHLLAPKRRGFKFVPSAMTPLLIAAASNNMGSACVLLELLQHPAVDTYASTTGDARGRLVEELAHPAMRHLINKVRAGERIAR